MYLLTRTQNAKFGGFGKAENAFPGTILSGFWLNQILYIRVLDW